MSFITHVHASLLRLLQSSCHVLTSRFGESHNDLMSELFAEIPAISDRKTRAIKNMTCFEVLRNKLHFSCDNMLEILIDWQSKCRERNRSKEFLNNLQQNRAVSFETVWNETVSISVADFATMLQVICAACELFLINYRTQSHDRIKLYAAVFMRHCSSLSFKFVFLGTFVKNSLRKRFLTS